MSLNGALHVGRSALVASQAAIQVAGNNMANAATEGFHRRTVHFSPIRSEVIGTNQYVGRGVQLDAIRREVDSAPQARHRDSISDENAAGIAQQYLNTIETIQNELTENDLSSLLSEFFNSFSELANNPTDSAIRSLVVEEGQRLADRVVQMRSDYARVAGEVDDQLARGVDSANQLLDQIANLNQQIVLAEPGGGEASALRDQRDLLIDQVAEYFDVTVIEHGSGSLDLLVDSVPIILGGQSRGVEFRIETVNGELDASIRVAEDGTHILVQSGRLGGLMAQRDSESVASAVSTLEEMATQLIHQVNLVHSQGQGLRGFETVTSTYQVDDTTVNLNSTGADLPFRVENGSFLINTTHVETGQRISFRIDVDGDAASLDDLVNQINVVVGVPNVTAAVTIDRGLTLTADAGFEISFSEDSSGALAALGINTFFDGMSANSIQVNQVLRDNPSYVAAGGNHVPGSNDTALALADLQNKPVDDLNGSSLRDFWRNGVNALAVQTKAANDSGGESARLVRENLFAQLQAVSGVSLDEEAINLITFQRQFQAAARFITAIDEALQILLSIA